MSRDLLVKVDSQLKANDRAAAELAEAKRRICRVLRLLPPSRIRRGLEFVAVILQHAVEVVQATVTPADNQQDRIPRLGGSE